MLDIRAASGGNAFHGQGSWREALSPANGMSPATTARSARSGGSARSFCSMGGTPHYDMAMPFNAATPTSVTPPSSPLEPDMSARSMGSNTSSRSGTRDRANLHYPAVHESSRSISSGSGAGRSSAFETPASSARVSELGSAPDSTSHCGTARSADLCSVNENEPASSSTEAQPSRGPSRKKQSAYAAAFNAFAPPVRKEGTSPSGFQDSEDVRGSLDPRQVFSAARHGRHKEVEASLAQGFDPKYVDSFGNGLFHVACQNGSKRIAKLAIKYGGDMDAQNLKGNTGVHFLFAYGYADIGEYFIAKGANPNILNEFGNDPRSGIR